MEPAVSPVTDSLDPTPHVRTNHRNPLGKTGLAVGPLGFGASPLGGVFGAVTQEEATLAVRAALEAGTNFFDVAPYYGSGQAEMVLGKALSGVPRDAFLLATKVGRYGSSDFDFSAERVTRSIDESLHRLGLDTIDLMQCHDIEFVDRAIVQNEALPALRRAREAGKIRCIGISGLPLSVLDAVVCEEDDLDTVLSYYHLNLVDTSLAEVLPRWQARGLGVIAASPLAMGLLTGNPVPDWHPAPAPLRLACVHADAWCRTQGTTLAQVALQFAFHQAQTRGVAVTLTGMKTQTEVAQNVAAWNAGPPDPSLLAHVRALLNPDGLPEAG